MKILSIILIFFSGLFLISSCGKPADPETFTGGYNIVKTIHVTAAAQDVVVNDNYAYIAQGEGGIAIVDIRDKTKPEFISYVTNNARGYSNKIAIKDNYVYVAAGSFGLTIVNVSDATHPVVTRSNINMKPARNVTIFDKYIFTAISEQGVKIAEISDPTTPDKRGRTATKGYARAVSISNDTTKMFVACGEMGLSIFDITDFQEGYGVYSLLSLCYTSGYAEDVVINNNNKKLAYVACGVKGLQIVDFSDIDNVHITGSFNTYGYAKELIYDNNKIYITTEKRGLQIIDVSDASNPKLIGVVSTEYALGVTQDKNYIYVADELQGLIIIAKI
jgi:hypothetical protein